MKAALVSATSLAALLAFEVGLDVAIDAHPAKAASFTASPSIVNFGYVLLNTPLTIATMTETVTNGSGNSNTVTFPSVSTAPFGGTSVRLSLAGSGTGTHPYTLSLPAGSSVTLSGGSIVPTTYSVNTTLSASGGHTSVVTLTAQAVAPVASVTVSAATTVINNTSVNQVGTTVRIGTTATIAALTVANIGNGDLYSNSSLSAQLQVTSIGAPSGSVFKGSAVAAFSLNDPKYTGGSPTITQSVFSYQYAPTTTGASTGNVTATFANGSSAGTNAAANVTATLTATGVGPVFGSTITAGQDTSLIGGTNPYTAPTTLSGSVTVSTSVTISTTAHFTGATYTSIATITLANHAPTGDAADLTSITDSVSISGSAGWTVVNNLNQAITTPITIAAGGTDVIYLDFSGSALSPPAYTAELNIDTDQGAAFANTSGAVFTYMLVAWVPEPATILTFGMGLAGLGWVRRRRAERTNTERRYGLI